MFQGGIPERVRLTEGILKADVATVLSGRLTLGLPGVSAWRHAIPLLCEIHVRTVSLAFDADANRNWNVVRALQRSATALRAAGIQVALEQWGEEDGKGIDDLLAAGKRPAVVIGKGTLEAIRAIARAAYRSDPLLVKQDYLRQNRLPTMDSWLGPRAALQGIPMTVRQIEGEWDVG